MLVVASTFYRREFKLDVEHAIHSQQNQSRIVRFDAPGARKAPDRGVTAGTSAQIVSGRAQDASSSQSLRRRHDAGYSAATEKPQKAWQYCQDCNLIIKTLRDLDKHRREMHMSDRIYSQCGICMYRSARHDKMKEHCRKIHRQLKGQETIEIVVS